MLKRRKKSYSLACLLYRQPKTVRRHQDYPELLARLNASARLQKIRIGRRCYGLLDRAVISAEHLGNFYATYRLFADPFFPLFFRIKADYLARRKYLGARRQEYITQKMAALPDRIRDCIERLGQLERKFHRSGLHPVWKTYFVPRTKKKTDLMADWDQTEWVAYFRKYLDACAESYPRKKHTLPDRVIAGFILGLAPDSIHKTLVSRQYRLLARQHHPDQGGSAEAFRMLAWAREVLLED
ncbi:MAG: hypothetical protein JW874_09305 [Spirochaetales bacterium]|nr:hypothetical protein [Spirochaetales bacterium]